MTRPLDGFAATDGEADIVTPDAPDFIAELARLEGYDAGTAARLVRIVGLIAIPAAGILIRDGGRAVAAVLAVQTGAIGVYLNVIV
ncbi:hypothetical protein J8J27_28470, partial [Mycobacterium tuberculosis]|nr:hypothetical protein [Mycobacterium tuberculosis]